MFSSASHGPALGPDALPEREHTEDAHSRIQSALNFKRCLVPCVVLLPFFAVLSTVIPFIAVFWYRSGTELNKLSHSVGDRLAVVLNSDVLNEPKTASHLLREYWDSGALDCCGNDTLPDWSVLYSTARVFDITFCSVFFGGLNESDPNESIYVGISRSGSDSDSYSYTYVEQAPRALHLSYWDLLPESSSSTGLLLGNLTKINGNFSVTERPYYLDDTAFLDPSSSGSGYWGSPYVSTTASGPTLTLYHVVPLRRNNRTVGFGKSNLSMERFADLLAEGAEEEGRTWFMVVLEQGGGEVIGTSLADVGAIDLGPGGTGDPERIRCDALGDAYGIAEFCRVFFVSGSGKGYEMPAVVSTSTSSEYVFYEMWRNYVSVMPVSIDNLQWLVLVFQPRIHVISDLALSGAILFGSTGGIVCLFCVLGIAICLIFRCVMTAVEKNTEMTQARLGRLELLDNFEMHLAEQEDQKDMSTAHLSINKKMFHINYDAIKVQRVIGEGGSSSVVFRAEWRGLVVAFKCFKSKDILVDQEHYKEFENEVHILASISHPHILVFYGATLKPPRIGIVLEYCERGDVKDFLIWFRHYQLSEFPFDCKLRFMWEIALATWYLHRRQIIHRDLKLENVLVTAKQDTRLMDFGLSRVVEQMDSKDKTQRVGTSIYMAPEVVLGGDYNERCDLFSFGILMYIIATEDYEPYGKQTFNMEFKTANDPTMRPNIDAAAGSGRGLKQHPWLVALIKSCWDHDPEERPSFEKITETIAEKRQEMKSPVMRLRRSLPKDPDDLDAAKERSLDRCGSTGSLDVRRASAMV